MKKNDKPSFENEKQIKPMPGEVDPKDARVKGAEFAAKEMQSIKKVTPKK